MHLISPDWVISRPVSSEQTADAPGVSHVGACVSGAPLQAEGPRSALGDATGTRSRGVVATPPPRWQQWPGSGASNATPVSEPQDTSWMPLPSLTWARGRTGPEPRGSAGRRGSSRRSNGPRALGGLVRYLGCVLAKIGAHVWPRVVGKWMLLVSIPLTVGWVVAAAATKSEVFIGPFWGFMVTLVAGTGLCVWGPVATNFSLQRGMLRIRRGAARHSISQFKLDLGLSRAVVIEELAWIVACFFLFWALIGN